MTLFLRDKKNNTLCECDFFTDDGSLDVSCSVSILNYTKLLMRIQKDIWAASKIFEGLDQMRGLLWEMNTEVMGKDYDMEKAIDIVRTEYEKAAKLYDLFIVED